MYTPPAFREDRRDVLHAAIRTHPLGTLVTAGPHGPSASLIPFDLSGDVLRGHLAKANEQIADLRTGAAALVLFQGPHGYVSPSWYASKAAHGKVVPTWNYVAVEARGIPRVIDDADWLREQVGALTRTHEAGRAAPWQIEDAPAAFVAAQLKGIVGVEIPLTSLTGKWKVSQNRDQADRAGVATGLRADGRDSLADLVPR